MKVTHKPAAEQKKKVLSPQLLSFFVVGIAFGIIMVQAEIISWFRIFEMFHFYSFHMYGVIGTAVVLGIVIHWLIRKGIIRNIRGERIVVPPKAPTYKRYLLGGTVFGLGTHGCLPGSDVHWFGCWLSTLRPDDRGCCAGYYGLRFLTQEAAPLSCLLFLQLDKTSLPHGRG
jgi:hypothetical protein